MSLHRLPTEYTRQLLFSNVLPAVKVNLPDNTTESEPCRALIHWEMLIKVLAYKRMNDLKDAQIKAVKSGCVRSTTEVELFGLEIRFQPVATQLGNAVTEISD